MIDPLEQYTVSSEVLQALTDYMFTYHKLVEAGLLSEPLPAEFDPLGFIINQAYSFKAQYKGELVDVHPQD